MKQAVLLIDCYLYGTIAILAVVLLVLVYLHGQAESPAPIHLYEKILSIVQPLKRGVCCWAKNMVCWRTHQSGMRGTLS